MISRTLRMGMPYSSSPRPKVRNFPPRAAAWDFSAVEVSLMMLFLSAGSGVNNSCDIENQTDISVAEDGATGDAGQVADFVADGFDDDLLLSDEFVHKQAAASRPVLNNHHERFRGVLMFWFHIE